MAEQHDRVAEINGTLCNCGNPIDVIPANGDRFRQHTICHEVIFFTPNFDTLEYDACVSFALE